MPVIKKIGTLRVCIDFRDLNQATLKDEYSMPVEEMLVDSAAGFEYLSMIDGYSGYNQILIAEKDVPKTAFRCPGAIGTYEWVVMPFGHIDHLRLPFEKMRKYGLKMNPLKCAFGVRAGDFLGFVVHKKGIEIN